MNTKPWYQSVTIWGALVTAAVTFIKNNFHVDLSDEVGPISDYVLATVQFIGVIVTIVGRFAAVQPITLGSTSPSVKLLPFALALGLGGACCSLVGCGAAPLPSTAGTTTASPTVTSSAIESALPIVRTGAAVATGAVLDFTVNQSSTRTRLANEMYSAANAIYTLTGGSFPSPAQFESTVLSFGGSQADANYAQFSTAIAAIYTAYFPKLQTGDTKTATDLLNAIAGGIEDATQSYVTTPVAASNPTSLWQTSDAGLLVLQQIQRMQQTK